jgi:hypothetical protein
VFVLLGLEPTPAALAATLTGLAELFYHWNVRTPYWLGFLLQRPESHCVHHQQGHHTSNFSDLPIWDLLFGTFHNPRIAPEDCGFGPDIERRLPDLLLGRRLSVARGEQVMRYWIPAAGLLIVGCVQMAGDLSGNRELRGLGLATHASPAPKVFTSQEGFETFSSRFFIDWTDTAGRDHSLEVTPRSYRGVRGPYNRRNAYGAALSYGPVLDSSERTRPMLRSVMRHAFCGPAPLLRELLVAPEQVRHPLRVRLEPREEGNRAGRWITTFEVTCEEERS